MRWNECICCFVATREGGYSHFFQIKFSYRIGIIIWQISWRFIFLTIIALKWMKRKKITSCIIPVRKQWRTIDIFNRSLNFVTASIFFIDSNLFRCFAELACFSMVNLWAKSSFLQARQTALYLSHGTADNHPREREKHIDIFSMSKESFTES